MSRVLPPQDKELIPSFFAHHQHIHEPVFFRDIVQDTVISQTKFPRGYRIETQELDAARFLCRLIAEMKLDAVEDNPLGLPCEPTNVAGRLLGDNNGIRLSDGRAPNCVIELHEL
jgi:hypothetical protein